MSDQSKYRLGNECYTTGDTWKGMEMHFDEDITGWIFRMWVVKVNATRPYLSFTTEGDNPNIIITDGPNGEVVWSPFEIALSPGIYKYDIEISKPDGTVKTYFDGQWTIENDITKAES